MVPDMGTVKPSTGQAASASGLVQHRVTQALPDAEGWVAILAGALGQAGGPLTKRERAWADEILAGTDAKERRRSKAAPAKPL